MLSFSLFAQMLIDASDNLANHRDYLNSINVYPVADKDTGNNMVYTTTYIKTSIIQWPYNDRWSLLSLISRAALIWSRGNSGTVLSQWISWWVDWISEYIQWWNQQISIDILSNACIVARDRAFQSFVEPQSGTILDTMSAICNIVIRPDMTHKEYMDEIIVLAQYACEQTRHTMKILRKSDIMDSGAAGFVIRLQGMRYWISSDHSYIVPVITETSLFHNMSEIIDHHEFVTYRYCTECIIFNNIYAIETWKDLLKDYGDSLQVMIQWNNLKIHIHTDDPEWFKYLCSQYGTVDYFKVDDMTSMIHIQSWQKIPYIFVVDGWCDMPSSWILETPVIIVDIPLYNAIDGQPLIVSNRDDFYAKMKDTNTFKPQTSQPNIHNYKEAFSKAIKKADTVICLTISSRMSGSYNSALNASRNGYNNIIVIDTYTASAWIWLMLKLLDNTLSQYSTLSHDQVYEIASLIKWWLQSYVLPRSLRYLARSGRVSTALYQISRWFWLTSLLRTHNWVLQSVKKLWFVSDIIMINVITKIIKKFIIEQSSSTYMVLAYTDKSSWEIIHRIYEWLTDYHGVINISIIAMNPVIGSHAGPGTIACFIG